MYWELKVSDTLSTTCKRLGAEPVNSRLGVEGGV